MKRGFTLIELLIALAIINIIVAIAIPNLLTAVQRGRQKRTMADIKTVANTWERYYVDYSYYWGAGGCPKPEGGGADISTARDISFILIPTYIAKLPLKDGWNNPMYFYTDSASKAQEYRIVSLGQDGISDDYCGMTISFGNDIVLANGQFIEWPEGTQMK